MLDCVLIRTRFVEKKKNSHGNGEEGNQHKSIKRALCVCNNLNIFVRPYLILLFMTRMLTKLYIENHFVWGLVGGDSGGFGDMESPDTSGADICA